MIDSMQQAWLNQVTKAVFKRGHDSGVSIFKRVEPGPITVARYDIVYYIYSVPFPDDNVTEG